DRCGDRGIGERDVIGLIGKVRSACHAGFQLRRKRIHLLRDVGGVIRVNLGEGRREGGASLRPRGEGNRQKTGEDNPSSGPHRISVAQPPKHPHPIIRSYVYLAISSGTVSVLAPSGGIDDRAICRPRVPSQSRRRAISSKRAGSSPARSRRRDLYDAT